MLFVGIDWADKNHMAVAVDQQRDPRRPLFAFSFEHSRAGVQSLVRRCLELEPEPSRILFCFEAAKSLLFTELLDAGFRGLAVNPRQTARCRERFHASGKKDDLADARALAWIARDEPGIGDPVSSDQRPETELLAELCALREQLARDKTALHNQLTANLKLYYPLARKLFSGWSSDISLRFLEEFPAPDRLKGVSRQEFRQFFVRWGYSRPWAVDSMFERTLEPQLEARPAGIPALELRTLGLVQRLRLVIRQLKQCEQAIVEAARRHPLFPVLRSLPAVSELTVGRLIAVLGDDPAARFQSYRHLQMFAGAAPVTVQSGSFKRVKFRRACSKTARCLFHNMAFSFAQWTPWAREYYLQRLDSGKGGKQAALRSLAAKIIKIVFAMARDRAEYDESIFLGRRREMAIAQRESELGIANKKQRKRTGREPNKGRVSTSAGSDPRARPLPPAADQSLPHSRSRFKTKHAFP